MNVVLYVKDGYANIWTDHYVKRQPQSRQGVLMSSAPSTEQVVDTIKNAAKKAGPGGTLIFNLGHGGTSGPSNTLEGFVDLAPAHRLRLGGQGQLNIFINVFYDTNIAGPPSLSDMDNDLKFNKDSPEAKQRQQHWKTYKKICQAFQDSKLYRVIFLTCKVGNSTDFIKKIANDWGVVVTAPKRRVVLTPQKNGNVRIHLEGDAPGFGTNVPESEQELLVFNNANSYSAGPPLKP